MTKLPEQLLSQAIAMGAEAAEVFQSGSLSRPIVFEGNRLKQAETSQSEGISLRLWKNGRPGLAVGYGPIEPQALVEKALAISTLNVPETPCLSTGQAAESSLTEPQRNFPDIGAAVDVEQLVAWGEEAIAQIRDRFPEVVCEAELSCDMEQTRLINSNGLDYHYQDTSLSGYISAELINPDDFLCVSDGTVNRNHIDMGAVADNIIQRMSWAQRTVTLSDLNHRNLNHSLGQQLPVIFTPGAAWLLWNTLRTALNGKRVREGISPWSQKWGDIVIDPAITLQQNPTVGPYSCPFDDEGVLTQSLEFVENGRLKNWYCDQTLGQPNPDTPIPGLGNGSTGNGIRPDLSSYPTPGLINFLVTPGDVSWDDLISQFSEAIIVDQVLGEGGDLTGDMSVNLELGYCVHHGEIIGRVKDTMVSGNAYTALNTLIALGSDMEWSGSTYTPSVAVGSLSVTG